MRSSDGRIGAALQRALRSSGFEPEQVAIADFHPEGQAMVGDAAFDWIWVTMVSANGSAFIGDLMINDDGEHFRRLVEVPARSIPESTGLAQQLSDNRRQRVPWDTGLPDWVTSPDDFLYNREIQNALAYIADEQARG